MRRGFAGVGVEGLRSMAAAIESGRLGPPYSALALQRFTPLDAAEAASAELAASVGRGATAGQLAYTLRLLAEERDGEIRGGAPAELVWSGPEVPTAVSRDTAVVVRELFSQAQRSVLVSGFAVYNGKRVFKTLAENLDATAELRVRMFFNIYRAARDERSDEDLTREFAERFRNQEWPGDRLPEVYYDPRSLSRDPGPRACLHAKCVVIDEEAALVTSANFTEAAHERNIEAGVLLRATPFARALVSQFETLIQAGALRRLAGS